MINYFLQECASGNIKQTYLKEEHLHSAQGHHVDKAGRQTLSEGNVHNFTHDAFDMKLGWKKYFQRDRLTCAMKILWKIYYFDFSSTMNMKTYF